MTAEEMWLAYCNTKPSLPKATPYSAWSYGTTTDELAELTLTGVKTATCSAHEGYKNEQEPLPVAGEHSVVLNSTGEATCIIRTTQVYIVPFSEITEAHAIREGDGSLENWRAIHKEFFTKELQSQGLTFSEDMLVVCEEFIRVYP